MLDQYEPADMARKVVGVGSVGTRCWIALMLGRDGSDPLILQVKQAEESVLSRFAGASAYSSQGQRVVDGQPRDYYYVRQLRDWKSSADIDTMSPGDMRSYGELCGWTLARAHARSGDRIAIAAYLGNSDAFDRAVAQFASGYADQTEHDHNALVAAVASGRIKTVRDL